jgi:hypothetical protein
VEDAVRLLDGRDLSEVLEVFGFERTPPAAVGTARALVMTVLHAGSAKIKGEAQRGRRNSGRLRRRW